MSGHRSFQSLTKDFSPERLAAIAKRQESFARLELQEVIAVASQDWEVNPETNTLERVNACLAYLRQAVESMGGELAVTAKFPNDVEVVIDTFGAEDVGAEDAA